MLRAEVRIAAGHFQRSVPYPLLDQIAVYARFLESGDRTMPERVRRSDR
jgi:hypothetical protein